MRKLVYYVAVTLDGFVAGPHGEDPSGTEYFPLYPDIVEYIKTHFPETLPTPARAALGVDDEGTTFDAVVEGRTSYEGGIAQGITDAYKHLRHVVFSTTLESHDAGVEVVQGDPVEFVRQMKKEDGKDIFAMFKPVESKVLDSGVEVAVYDKA